MTLYYVKNGGSDAADGLSDENAWETIDKVNGSAFNAGDSVLFKKGSTWREQLTVPSSGSEGSPITFGVYGSGDDPKITGADILSTTGWSLYSPSPETFVSDTFDRADGAGWGNADGGTDSDKTWDTSSGFSIATNKGAYTAAWGYGVNGIGDAHSEDVDAKADWAGIASGADRECGFRLRRSGTTLYRIYFKRNDTLLRVYQNPAGTLLGSTNVGDVGSGAFSIRARVTTISSSNVHIQVRIWAGSEPGTWNLDLNDTSSPITGAGDIVVELGNLGTGSATLDNFTFTDIVASYSYTYQKALTTDPGNFVLEDGVRLTKVASIALVESTESSFYWASNVIYIRATGSGDPTSNGKVYETPIRSTMIQLNGKDYITVDSLTLEMAQGTGMTISGDKADNFTLQNSILRYSNFIHYWVWDDSPPVKTNNGTFSGNSFSYAGGGLYMHGDSISIQNNTFSNITRTIEMRDNDNSHCASFLIELNAFSNCGSAAETNAGILLDGDTNGDNADYHYGIIRYNSFATLLGRAIDGFYGDSQIYYNLFNNIQDGAANSGIAIEVNGPNNVVYNNLIYNVQNMGIMFNNDPIAPNVQSVAKNNILFSSTVNHIIWVSNDAGLSPTINYNCYWMGTGGETKYYWKTADYTFTNWKTQSGRDANSKEVDPLFVNAGTDFHLQSTSPCINAGVKVGLTQDYEGNPVTGTPDIGAYEKRATFSRSRRRARVYGRPF